MCAPNFKSHRAGLHEWLNGVSSRHCEERINVAISTLETRRLLRCAGNDRFLPKLSQPAGVASIGVGKYSATLYTHKERRQIHDQESESEPDHVGPGCQRCTFVLGIGAQQAGDFGDDLPDGANADAEEQYR